MFFFFFGVIGANSQLGSCTILDHDLGKKQVSAEQNDT